MQRVRAYENGRQEAAAELFKYAWLPTEEIRLAAFHPTTLWPLTPQAFDRLERHGYESIRWNDLLFGSQSQKCVHTFISQ
jgi:NTE family protein